MTVQIAYSYDPMHGYPFKAVAIVGGRVVAIGVSGQSFEDAKARLLGRLETMKAGGIPPAEFIEIDGLMLPMPQPPKAEPENRLRSTPNSDSSKPDSSKPKPQHNQRREWIPAR